ncbi:MAG TPA: winged helix-turn-helix domain-containing protein [Candidatus Micrarchaeota archaeon]|nr:winged helix-turn-helix domain-containing protein [Candidatus Micrarchaeota archaeon]
MKTILFYWSKGADIRRDILRQIAGYEKKDKPCYLNLIADNFGLSHVAIKKHIDLLVDEGYVHPLNPKGKPVYLAVTKLGYDMLKEFGEKG